MLIRNVGHLMTNPAILLKNGEEIPEGIMDASIIPSGISSPFFNKIAGFVIRCPTLRINITDLPGSLYYPEEVL